MFAARRGWRREKCLYLRGSGAVDFDSLVAAALAASDSNRRQRHIQTTCEKAPQRLIGAIFDGRSRQTDAQRPLPLPSDFVTAGSRLHPHEETNDARALAHVQGQRSGGRSPKTAVPTRICVAPSSMAISKSRDIPMESSDSGSLI